MQPMPSRPGFQSRKAAKEANPPPAATAAWPARERREEQNIELCECLIDVAAALFNVSSKDLRHPGRTSLGSSRVRQIAMYVAHVVLGMSMSEVGRGFARDRTTVMYACHLIEDMRDDQEFDRIVAMTERVAAAIFRKSENA